MNFQDILQASKDGGAVLFCGAGFSADCLNLADQDELGTGATLLRLLNTELSKDIGKPYRDLKNAADKFLEVRGEHGLLSLLRDRFRTLHTTEEMSGLLRFAWDRIYTTNYDNAVELACAKAGKNFKPLNNLDTREAVPRSGLEIIHLHGMAEKWDIHNFRQSCILGADSYFDANRTIAHWLVELQRDYDRARLFVFVGFAAGDFHLNRVFFNAKDARSKVFFVNRPAATVDPDLTSIQDKFGVPLAIGRLGLSKLVDEVLKSDKVSEPPAPSFRLHERAEQAAYRRRHSKFIHLRRSRPHSDCSGHRVEASGLSPHSQRN